MKFRAMTWTKGGYRWIHEIIFESNAAQITLLVVVNLFVGGMVGLERTVLPLVAKQDFGLAGASAAIACIISFGVVKAISNRFARQIADVMGRKRLLVAGWIIFANHRVPFWYPTDFRVP